MKKIGLLNQSLSTVIAGMGHNDKLVIADAGLPIPSTTQRIDLAIAEGIPTFLQVLKATLQELQVERAIIAEEMVTRSPQAHADLVTMLGDIPIDYVSHEHLKQLTATSTAVVRTGEFTPYANVILVAGVVF
jgi:D-ribose pyranase